MSISLRIEDIKAIIEAADKNLEEISSPALYISPTDRAQLLYLKSISRLLLIIVSQAEPI